MPVLAPRRAAALLGTALLLATAGCAGPDDAGPRAEPTGAPAVPSSTGTAEPGPAGGDADLVPERGAYLGVYYGDRSPAETDEAVGRTPQVHLTYVGWEDDWATSDVVRDDLAQGRVPLVNWEPYGVDLADVVAGDHDEMLAERGRAAAELGAQVFVDLAAEMNGDEAWGDHDPDLYVAAYRHVHDVVTRYDDGNVVWVWAVDDADSPGSPGALEYYPGEEYVDWTGVDGYDWGTDEPGFGWRSFAEVFRPAYAQLHPLGKPVVVAETASTETGGSKADWIAGIVPALRTEFPDVRAVVWFDVEKERDWRIRSSDSAQAAFRAMAADETFAAVVP